MESITFCLKIPGDQIGEKMVISDLN